jgi:hypothetical protein
MPKLISLIASSFNRAVARFSAIILSADIIRPDEFGAKYQKPCNPNKPTLGLERGQFQLVEKVESGKMGPIIAVDVFPKRD